MSIRKEIGRSFTSSSFWMAVLLLLMCFSGYSLPEYWRCWMNPATRESIEYCPSALELSLGGIFFGGVILLFPYFSALCYAPNQIDEMRSGMTELIIIRCHLRRYAYHKMISAFLTTALAGGIAFSIHTLLCHCIALPYDIENYPAQEIGLWQEGILYPLSQGKYAIPMLAEIGLGLTLAAGCWSVIALSITPWIQDKVLIMVIPACIYELWNLNITRRIFGVSLPDPETWFNDAQTVTGNLNCALVYLILLLLAVVIYQVGLSRRYLHG